MRLMGRGLGRRRMSAPSLAEPTSVLLPTPSSIMKVEKRSPTTTATAIAMTNDRKRATLRFLPIREYVFNYDHLGFASVVLKPLLGRTMDYSSVLNSQSTGSFAEKDGNPNLSSACTFPDRPA